MPPIKRASKHRSRRSRVISPLSAANPKRAQNSRASTKGKSATHKGTYSSSRTGKRTSSRHGRAGYRGPKYENYTFLENTELEFRGRFHFMSNNILKMFLFQNPAQWFNRVKNMNPSKIKWFVENEKFKNDFLAKALLLDKLRGAQVIDSFDTKYLNRGHGDDGIQQRCNLLYTLGNCHPITYISERPPAAS